MKNQRLFFLLFTYLIIQIGYTNFNKAQSLDEIVAKFERRSYTLDTTILPYRLFIPENYNSSTSYPLVLCLHGSGEIGTDNEIHIRLHRLATSWADTINQNRWPCFVVAPQCPPDDYWVYDTFIDSVPISQALLASKNLLDTLATEFNIDQNRLYVTGLSMGGFATWDLIARYPNTFAGAIPMSAGGDTSKVHLFKDVPVWNFHGKLDNAVLVKYSRQMNEAYARNGIYVVQAGSISESILDFFLSQGAKHLYTEYPNGGHVIWAESYDYPKLFPWVFSQTKSNTVKIDSERSVIKSYDLKQNYPNPFNPTTIIQYAISSRQFVSLKLYDVLGNEIETLVNEEKEAGSHSVEFSARGGSAYGGNASDLPSGVYFYKLTAGNFISTRKMLLLK
jgi:poly(3-hydroxybutyrate) depolymerase